MLGDLRGNRLAYDPNKSLHQPLPPSAKGAPAQPEETVLLAQVVDAFTYNTQLLYLPNRFFPNALAQLDILRRAANYRPRWWVIPDDIDQPIQPYDTLYFQVEVPANSYLWGYSFTSVSAVSPADAPIATTASDLLIQVVDSCTGVPLGQDFQNGGGNSSDFDARCLPILLNPRLILAPGLVNVEISNRTPNTITCQLLLHFAEPCKIITEQQREQEWQKGIAGLRGLK